MEKLLDLIKKYRSVLIYLVFGVLTTLVNYIVYFPCYNGLHLSAASSNIIAWVFAVIFAYLTNKPFVFESKDWSAKTVIPEFAKFTGTRIASGAIETVMIWLAVDAMGWNGNIWKVITSILVVIINYIGSKLFVFREKKQ